MCAHMCMCLCLYVNSNTTMTHYCSHLFSFILSSTATRGGQNTIKYTLCLFPLSLSVHLSCVALARVSHQHQIKSGGKGKL